MNPSQPYVITKPGGLSSAAHAVHIFVCFFTCGLWIPGYLLFVIFAPRQRKEVVSPIGVPGVAQPLRLPRQITPAERDAQINRTLIRVAVIVSPFVLTVSALLIWLSL